MKILQLDDPEIRNPRRVWVSDSHRGESHECCIFLDAEIYLDQIGSEKALDQPTVSESHPAITSIYLSSGEPEDRHRDFICSDPFADFLADQFVSWIEKNIRRFDHYYLCGLSLSGLAAAHAVCRHPQTFAGAICQSPSAWWNNEWLARHMPSAGLDGRSFWISVGNEEVAENVSHSPDLFQEASQLDSCRRLAESLQSAGARSHFEIFDGGHDLTSWREDLPKGLNWLATTDQ